LKWYNNSRRQEPGSRSVRVRGKLEMKDVLPPAIWGQFPCQLTVCLLQAGQVKERMEDGCGS